MKGLTVRFRRARRSPGETRTYSGREIAEQLLPVVRMLRHAEAWELRPDGVGPYEQVEHAYSTAIFHGLDLPGRQGRRVVELTVEDGLSIDQAVAALQQADDIRTDQAAAPRLAEQSS